MQESRTQLRKKEYPAGEHPEEEYCTYRRRNYKKINKKSAGSLKARVKTKERPRAERVTI
jgi:hypothetical protein